MCDGWTNGLVWSFDIHYLSFYIGRICSCDQFSFKARGRFRLMRVRGIMPYLTCSPLSMARGSVKDEEEEQRATKGEISVNSLTHRFW